MPPTSTARPSQAAQAAVEKARTTGKNKLARTDSLHRAALSHLAIKDHPDVAVRDVADTAGASNGAVYSRWTGKDELLDEVTTTELTDRADALTAALTPEKLDGLSAPERVRAVVQAIADAVGPDCASGCMDAATSRMRHGDPAKSAASLVAIQTFRQSALDAATEALEPLVPIDDDNTWAVFVSARAAMATLYDAARHQDGPLAPNSDALIDTLAAMIGTFLNVEGANGVEIIEVDDEEWIDPPDIESLKGQSAYGTDQRGGLQSGETSDAPQTPRTVPEKPRGYLEKASDYHKRTAHLIPPGIWKTDKGPEKDGSLGASNAEIAAAKAAGASGNSSIKKWIIENRKRQGGPAFGTERQKA